MNVLRRMAGQKEDKDREGHIVGTCMGMCPNAELRLRQREGLVHPLECSMSAHSAGVRRTDPRAMVKEFSRSAAGHHIKAVDVRPLPVLFKTVKYLFTNVCIREDVSWTLNYQFVSDRVRAVRQDLCVQDIRTLGLSLHQAAVRFYVYAHYRTCEHELIDFDPHINHKQLVETLSLVLSLYQDLDRDHKPETKASSSSALSDGSSLYRCDECDGTSDEDESSSSDSDSESDDVSERKIVQDSVASEKESLLEAKQKCEGTITNNGQSEEQSGEHSEDKNTVYGSDESEEQSTLQNNDSRTEDAPHSSDSSERIQASSSKTNVAKMPELEILHYSPREEAEALNLLVNFGREEALMHVLQLPSEIRQSRLVRLATEMNVAWLGSNYSRVLRLAPLLTPLCLAAFHAHINIIHRRALIILNGAHSSRAGLVYNGEDLASVLRFPNTEALLNTCSHYGLTTSPAGVIFTKGAFKYEAPLMKSSRSPWVDERLSTVSVPELLLPANLVLPS